MPHMKDTHSTAPNAPTPLSRSQQRVVRKLTLGAAGAGILLMVLGTVLDLWLSTPGRNSFGSVFGLFMLLVYGARFAYLRGINDARAEAAGELDQPSKA